MRKTNVVLVGLALALLVVACSPRLVQSVVFTGSGHAVYFNEAAVGPVVNETLIGRLTVTTSGNPVMVDYGAVLAYCGAPSSGTFRLYRDGDMRGSSLTVKVPDTEQRPVTLHYLDTPAAGTHVYDLKLAGSAAGVAAFNRCLTTLEFVQ